MLPRLQGGYSWEGVLSAYRGCRNVVTSVEVTVTVVSCYILNLTVYLE